MRQGRRRGGLLLAFLLGSAATAAAQDEVAAQDAPGPPDSPLEFGDIVQLESTEDERIVACVGSVSLRYGPYEMRADRVLLWMPPLGGQGESPDDPIRVGARIPSPPGALPLPERSSMSERIDPLLRNLREIYLEGNVLWRRGDDCVIFADSLHYDFIEERGTIAQGRVIAQHEQVREARRGRPRENRQYSLQLRAEELRMRGLDGLDVVNGEFTTCTYGEPHYHVHSEEVSIDFEPDNTDPDSVGDIRVSSSGNALYLSSTPVLPLPSFSFSADAEEGLPLRSVRVGKSSKLGGFVQTEWGWDLRDQGRAAHNFLGIDGDFDGDLELAVDAMGKRGPGLGPTVQYASEGKYFGETGTYFVHDRADEDLNRLSRADPNGQGDPFQFDIDNPLRGRAYTRNRFFLNETWNLDLESHWFSDRSFQAEYFEREAKEAKVPESYAHLVRRSGTTRTRALYRNKLNDYDTQVDSLPQLSFEQIAFPLFSLPGSSAGSLILDQSHEVARLRLQPDEDLDLRSADVGRADSILELSSPFEMGPVGVRPYANGRFTGYDETFDEGPSTTRFASQAGVRAELPFHQDFDVLAPAFRVDGLRHIVLLDAGYDNTWTSTRDPSEFNQLDEVDAVTEFQQYLVGIRQRLQTWRGGRVQTIVQLDLEMPLYAEENRDNPVDVDLMGRTLGRTAGPLRFDFMAAPGFTTKGLENTRVFAEGEIDVNRREMDILNTGVAVRPMVDWWTTLSYRVARGRSRVITGGSDWRLTEKWSLGVLIQHDLRENQALEQRLNLRRHGHDFVVDVAFARDEGEGNTSFVINLSPVFFRARAGDPAGYDRGTGPGFAEDYDQW